MLYETFGALLSTLKALQLANSTIPFLCQPAYQGCAGIGHQLHPSKVKYWMREKMIKNLELNVKMKCRIKYINQKLLILQTQLSHCNASQHIEDALEVVVNCISWRQKIKIVQNRSIDLMVAVICFQMRHLTSKRRDVSPFVCLKVNQSFTLQEIG